LQILIVEDSPLLQKAYGLAFPGREHVLITSANGREALRLLDHLPACDLVLLDLQMPEMNGVEFIRTLRNRVRYRALPIIVVTAEPDDSELLREARALGVAGVVSKPWRPHELRELVSKVLSGTPSGDRR
jgi:two-component system, chemotaxis family, chemotaxis protein CheY